MQISENGVKFICEFEGYSSTAYLDSAKIWTIGYGTIKYPSGEKVSKGDTCTKQEAESYLKFEIDEKCAYFNAYINSRAISFLQCEYDALVSFFYNVGIGKCFPGTTMGDAIRSNDREKISKAFLIYNRYTARVLGIPIKRVSKGLDRRRKAESLMFTRGIYDTSK
jgi:lysozyme